jgi:hypothetical protein
MREICTSSLGGGRRSAPQGAPPPTRQRRGRRTNPGERARSRRSQLPVRDFHLCSLPISRRTTRFVEPRISDRRMNRLVRKWLKAGAMEEGELVTAEKNCSDECTNLSHYGVSGWDKLYGILRVSCCADQLQSSEYLPALCYGSLATSAPAPESKRPVDMATDRSTCKGVLASTPNPLSLAERTLRRKIPNMGARCVNHARRDLCGCSAMSIPTAISFLNIHGQPCNVSRIGRVRFKQHNTEKGFQNNEIRRRRLRRGPVGTRD